MRVVFCGTPQFAVPSLERLYANAFDIPLVVTQPDRPRGRGLALTASPVKELAANLELPIEQPEKIKNNPHFQEQLRQLQPDAVVVVGYGRIIPPWMLALPTLGNINVHASLLPKYRGAAPIQWAIASGETVTGVTTMQLNEGLDTGDILMQREMSIAPDDTAVTLDPRLAKLGADLLIDTLRGLEKGTLHATPQNHSQATLAPILKKEDGLIDFNRSASVNFNRMRGFQPWPGAYTRFRGSNLKVTAARPADLYQHLAHGELLVAGDRLFAGCGQDTSLELLQLQPESKKPMSVRDFLSGYRVQAGERLG